MSFSVLVATDLDGSKINLELSMVRPRTLSEFREFVEQVFTTEAARSGSARTHPVRISTFNLYDDRRQDWVPLSSPTQLTDCCQLYAFQPDVTETQQEIPPPRLPSGLVGRRSEPPMPRPSRIDSIDATNLGNRSHVSPIRHGSPFRASPSRPPDSSFGGRLGETPNYKPSAALNSPGSLLAGATVAGRPSSRLQLYREPHPTMEYKIRVLFEEMDVKNRRMIDEEAFTRGLRDPIPELGADMVLKLFRRADRDRDGHLNFTEFDLFCRTYPTLVDALFKRHKNTYEEQYLRHEVAQLGKKLEDTQAIEMSEMMGSAEVRRRVEDAEAALMRQEAEVSAKAAMEEEQRTKLEVVNRDADERRMLKTDAVKELTLLGDRERQQQQQVERANRELEVIKRTVASADAEIARRIEKERYLERLLEEARASTQRARAERDAEVNKLLNAEAALRALEGDLQHLGADLQTAAANVAHSDAEFNNATKHFREAQEGMLHATRELALARQKLNEETVRLQTQREREHEHELRLENIRITIQQLRAKQDEIERELTTHCLQVQAQKEREMPMIDEELRLREQRYQLEEEEHRLANQSKSFFSMNP